MKICFLLGSVFGGCSLGSKVGGVERIVPENIVRYRAHNVVETGGNSQLQTGAVVQLSCIQNECEKGSFIHNRPFHKFRHVYVLQYAIA